MSTTLDRTAFLGASDVAAALGLSPWTTPYELWARKTGRLTEPADGESLRVGTALEPELLAWAEKQLGPLQKAPEVPLEGTPIVTHPDALTEEGDPVECKTTGVVGPVYGQWGEPGTDQIPEYYLVQCLVQLAATGGQVCHVPVLLGGQGFRMYQVPRHEELQQQIIERACRWWEAHVVADQPPESSEPPPLSVLKRLRREPEKVIQLERTDLVEAWLEAKERAREAQKAAEAAQAALVAALGDAEAAELPDGRQVTYFEQKRREYVVPAGSFRVLRIRGKKR